MARRRGGGGPGRRGRGGARVAGADDLSGRNGTSPPGPTLGVLEWFLPNEHARVERVLDSLRALGVERLRTGVSWADWHDAGGEEWYAWLLPRLASEVELLPCVVCTPPSIAIAPKIQAPPRRPRDYADFVDTLIRRHGDCFDAIELWNEPNNLNDWDWTLDPDWSAFCEMIGDAAHWARECGKRTVLGGMCPLDPNWLNLIGERGVLAKIDAVGIHAFPGSWETIWEGWEHAVARTREVLDRHGYDAEIWVTETGYSTWRHDEHAQLRAFVDALGAPVPRVYWYAAEDLDASRAACDGFHADVRHYHFGLSDSRGEPKLLHRTWAQGGIRGVRATAALGRPRHRRAREQHSLVIGGSGFVGTNVADRLLHEGRRVRVYDNLSRPGVEQNLRWLARAHGGRLAVEIADVRDEHALRDAVRGAREVFHLAAQVAVTTSLVDPVHDFAVNAAGTLKVLEELRRLPDPPPLLFTSTNKVYGTLPALELVRHRDRWEPADLRLRRYGLAEDLPLDFCTPYGCSKGAADQYVLDYAKSLSVPAVVFRMSCIYGPHQHGTEDQGWVAHFLLRTLADEPVTLYGDGAQVRDVLFVDDLVDAMLLAQANMERLAGQPFVMGGGAENTISLLELLDLIAELHGEQPDVRFEAERAGDQRYYVADTRRFRRATGWAPEVAVGDGVERLYDWLRRPHGTRDRPAAVAAGR